MPTFNDYYRVGRFKAHRITLAQMLRTLKLMRSGTFHCPMSPLVYNSLQMALSVCFFIDDVVGDHQ